MLPCLHLHQQTFDVRHLLPDAFNLVMTNIKWMPFVHAQGYQVVTVSQFLGKGEPTVIGSPCFFTILFSF